MPRRRADLVSLLLLLLLGTGPALAESPSYLLFESGPVRPLALTPSGAKLLAVNTPDSRLEIFDVGVSGLLTRAGSVPVGLEPVAVAALSDTEVWVVNHLSDSVSVVALDGAAPRVVRTLHVGDEPNDIVFAGPGDAWAFVTSAHRGQNSPNGGRINRTTPGAPDASQFDTPDIGRADVWVFDTTDLGSELGGTPANVITLFGDKPRALAVSNDGGTVYAAIFRSGNQTTALNEGLVCDTTSSNMSSDTVQPACTLDSGEASAGGYPPPHRNDAPPGASGPPNPEQNRPETGLIVKLNRDGGSSGDWQDELARDWSDLVRFDLPDLDVFAIDADPVSGPPVAVDGSAGCTQGSACWAHVGTTLFNMVVNPSSGKLYVSNTDAQNHVRFEGPGTHASTGGPGGTPIKPALEPPTVQGNLAQARITVIDGSSVTPRHLNTHIDYSVRPAPPGTADDSLATPLGMAVSTDGSTLYLAAFGSQKIGVFDTAQLENGTFTPSSADHIELSGGGPSGLLLRGGKLYVATRFDNAIAVIDPSSGTEDQKLALHSPEPSSIVEGRQFLYDARLTSSNGEASCAGCHIFGDLDDLAWDLGNPDDAVVANTNPFIVVGPAPLPAQFHPMKGPMTTQSLRGLVEMGPEHWRGDRQGDEVDAFTAFNVAFPGLLGRETELSSAQMAAFTEFALQIRYPPNPIRQLDNQLRSVEASGLGLFAGRTTDAVTNCVGCHTLDAANGHFGGAGGSTFEGETQHFKVPHLRNLYQKVGMFGMAQPEQPFSQGGAAGFDGSFEGDPDPFGDKHEQIRGFGFSHDGSIDTVFRFTSAGVFSVTPSEQTQLQAALMAFPTDLAPIVGQQLTLNPDNAALSEVTDRVALLEARAGTAFVSKILGGSVHECEVVAKLVEGGAARGYLYRPPPDDDYLPDDNGAPVGKLALRAEGAVAGQELTYTCAPPGSGRRLAIDRDEDLLLDGIETHSGIFNGAGDPGTDPANADTDGDGYEDGLEVLTLGTNPLDPLDPQPVKVPALSPLGAGALIGLLGLAGLRARRGGGQPNAPASRSRAIRSSS